MKTCLAMVVTPGYIDFAKTFLYSLKKNGGVSDLPFKIICTTEGNYKSLKDNDRDQFKKYWNNLSFVDVDVERYAKYKKNNPKYWAHEIFNFEGYDRAICFDSDLLCVYPIHELKEYACDIGMTKERRRPCFNAGVVLITKKYINKKTYDKVMAFQKSGRTYGNDQAVLNEMFRDEIIELPKKFNVLVSEVSDKFSPSILHYFIKPNKKENERRIDPTLYKLYKKYEKEALGL